MNCDASSYANLLKSEVMELATRKIRIIKARRAELRNAVINGEIARRLKNNKSLLGWFFKKSSDRDDVEMEIESTFLGFSYEDSFGRETMRICEDLISLCTLTANDTVMVSQSHVRAITLQTGHYD